MRKNPYELALICTNWHTQVTYWNNTEELDHEFAWVLKYQKFKCNKTSKRWKTPSEDLDRILIRYLSFCCKILGTRHTHQTNQKLTP